MVMNKCGLRVVTMVRQNELTRRGRAVIRSAM